MFERLGRPRGIYQLRSTFVPLYKYLRMRRQSGRGAKIFLEGCQVGTLSGGLRGLQVQAKEKHRTSQRWRHPLRGRGQWEGAIPASTDMPNIFGSPRRWPMRPSPAVFRSGCQPCGSRSGRGTSVRTLRWELRRVCICPVCRTARSLPLQAAKHTPPTVAQLSHDPPPLSRHEPTSMPSKTSPFFGPKQLSRLIYLSCRFPQQTG
jgi:hypothetical protein